MYVHNNRIVGENLNPTERELLELLCADSGALSAIARAQLTSAKWGGYEYEDCDCFLISITRNENTSPIQHDGGPFTVVEVSGGNDTLGFLELWVVDGLLHSVTYLPFGDDHVSLPTPANCHPAIAE